MQAIRVSTTSVSSSSRCRKTPRIISASMDRTPFFAAPLRRRLPRTAQAVRAASEPASPSSGEALSSPETQPGVISYDGSLESVTSMDVQGDVGGYSAASGSMSDFEGVKLDLNKEAGVRRSKQVSFTCNKCGGRSTRAVNPIAWNSGLVFAQCEHCKIWHVLSAKNTKIFEEVRYRPAAGSKEGEVLSSEE